MNRSRSNNYSVLMSVYHKEQSDYLRDAMNSIWDQTVKTDDFVLVCDGPLGEELNDVIRSMEENHSELKVIRLAENNGLGNALNIGIKYCKNELIARMDSDDISFLDRCERQIKAFKSSPEICICSGPVIEFYGSTNNVVGKRTLPISNEEIIKYSKKRNPFNHPATMVKKSAVLDAGGYSERFHLFEDYYLWIRMFMAGSKGMNLVDPVLFMRTPSDLYKRRGGIEYAKDMLAFHKWMEKGGWTSVSDYLTGAIPHAMICLLPNSLRKRIYKLLHG